MSGDEDGPEPVNPWGPVLYGLAVCVAGAALYVVVMRSVSGPDVSPLHVDDEAAQTRRVALLTWGHDPILDGVEAGLSARLAERGMDMVELVRADANHDPRGVEPMVRDALATPQIELVVAITTPVARAALAQADELPIVFAAVSDPIAAGLVPRTDAPPGGRVTGVSAGCAPGAGLDLLRVLSPGAERLGLLHDANLALLPPFPAQEAQERSLTLVPLVASSAEAVHGALEAGSELEIQALWVHAEWAAPSVTHAGFATVVDRATANGWPVIASDLVQLERGATAAVGPDWTAVGGAAAELVMEILAGGEPGTMQVTQFGCAPAVVHRARAAALGLSVEGAAAAGVRLVDDPPPDR